MDITVNIDDSRVDALVRELAASKALFEEKRASVDSTLASLPTPASEMSDTELENALVTDNPQLAPRLLEDLDTMEDEMSTYADEHRNLSDMLTHALKQAVKQKVAELVPLDHLQMTPREDFLQEILRNI